MIWNQFGPRDGGSSIRLRQAGANATLRLLLHENGTFSGTVEPLKEYEWS